MIDEVKNQFLGDPFKLIAALVLLAVVYCSTASVIGTSRLSSENTVPWAPGAIPFLGHALKYKYDPPGFLFRASNVCGDMFRLNMAGKHMVVITGKDYMKLVAQAPESIMSSRQAVADIGFKQTLGAINASWGTDLHKGIVKGAWQGNADFQVERRVECLRSAMAMYVGSIASGSRQDLFQFIRRIILRATIDHMISPDLLCGWNFNFVEEFMLFQDELENATAQAVVLPRWLALPLYLWPVQKKRQHLQKLLCQRLIEIGCNPAINRGYWWNEVNPLHPEEVISELIVGLLFAAHKNPAIGASQAYLMLQTLASSGVVERCTKESKLLLEETTWNVVQTGCPTLSKVCLETLRLTAHSIGAIRTAKEDAWIGDSLIPKGTSIALAHMTVHLKPSNWGNSDPKCFDITRASNLYEDEYLFTTFSQGVHKCPGKHVAITTLKTTLALLLCDHHVELPDTIPPLSYERATLAQRKGPVLVSVRKRNDLVSE